MIFRNFAPIFGLRSLPFPSLVRARLLHEVHHSPAKRIFYVTLDPIFDKQAVLYYKLNGQVMDLKAINVPSKFKGRGIARLLTETAFTYAIVNDYYLYLTCKYTQKYYLANKNKALEQRIVGPEHVLNAPISLDLEVFEEEPDPEDPLTKNKKD
ncbi:protein NATD1-like [Nasonia vitripennis]|uniref:Protein NATD1 n=1 Tax=Nasonia vitripennis TaxID=7425 RepID=A0A7M7Q2T1_NASVI|nr:protein NATD1-like [Nasonia vitripennis]